MFSKPILNENHTVLFVEKIDEENIKVVQALDPTIANAGTEYFFTEKIN